MPPEPDRIAEARPWVTKAAHDLPAAGVLLAANPPLIGEAAYHCQQAAEEALKGFLTFHDIPFGKTHDLAAIGGLCVRQDASLEPLCVRADRLSVFAWALRHPGNSEEPELGEVEDALNLARQPGLALPPQPPALQNRSWGTASTYAERAPL